MMRWLQWVGLPIGIGIFIALLIHSGVDSMIDLVGHAGFVLLWLLPFHVFPLLLDAYAWQLLLHRRASLTFLLWVAAVREGVSRVLPVPSIGGEIVGIRLAQWRVGNISVVSASVIVETLVTVVVQCAFSAIGLFLVLGAPGQGESMRYVGIGLLLSLPVPLVMFALMRRGDMFQAIQRWAGRLLGGNNALLRAIPGESLDREIRVLMSRMTLLGMAFLWQLAGYILGAMETYWALSWLGQPVSLQQALAIEALSQAVRHVAFMVPAGLGVQDAAIVMLSRTFGVDADVGMALALVKRMREVVFGCGALLSWQIAELMRRRVEPAEPPGRVSGGHGE